MDIKCHHKYFTFLIICYDNSIPLNQTGIICGIIYVEKGWPCEELCFKIHANPGVRFIELIPNKNYQISEQTISKNYSIYVGNSKHDDIVKIKFQVSLSGFEDSISRFADNYDRQCGCFDVRHELFNVEMSYKTNNKNKTISECLSISRQVTLFDIVKYSLKTMTDYLSKQQYIYAQCEMIDIIQKIKTFDAIKFKKLLLDLRKYHDLLSDTSSVTTIEKLIHNADEIILNFAAYG
jgi:hypothetical protein